MQFKSRSTRWAYAVVLLIAVGGLAFLLPTDTALEVHLVSEIDVPLRGTVVALTADRQSDRIGVVVAGTGLVICGSDPTDGFDTYYGDFHAAALIDHQSAIAAGTEGITMLALIPRAVRETVFVPGFANGVGMLPHGEFVVTSNSLSDLTAPGGIYLYDSESGLGEVVSLQDECGCGPVSVNGEVAASVCNDGKLRIYRFPSDNGAREVLIDSPVSRVGPARCCVGSRGNHVIVKDLDGLHSFRILNGSVRLEYTLPLPLLSATAKLQEVAMTSDERLGVTTRASGFIIFDIETGEELWSTRESTSAVEFASSTSEAAPGEYTLITCRPSGVAQWRITAESRQP